MSKYTPELAEHILAELAAGKTLRSICRGADITHAAVLGWVRTDTEAFAARYREARTLGYEVLADEIIDLGDEAAPISDSVAKARLQVDSREWLLSKALPKVYGDKLALAGDSENPVQVNHTTDAATRINQLLRKARGEQGAEP